MPAVRRLWPRVPYVVTGTFGCAELGGVRLALIAQHVGLVNDQQGGRQAGESSGLFAAVRCCAAAASHGPAPNLDRPPQCSAAEAINEFCTDCKR